MHGREPGRSKSPKRQCQDREMRQDTLHSTWNQGHAPLGEIRTIVGGFVGGGTTTSSRKADAHQARYHELYSIGKPSKYPKLGTPSIISFGDEDCESVLYPHEDALVVTLLVANYTNRWILVDNRSYADILFWKAFTKMGISPDRLRPSPTPLKGFSGEAVQPIGAIALPVTMGQGDNMATTMINFLVIKAHSSYNAILGRPTLNNLKVFTSTYHLKMKFPSRS